MFNHSMDRVNLPTGLQSLTFGTRFNQSLEQSPEFDLGRFDETLDHLDQLRLPASLHVPPKFHMFNLWCRVQPSYNYNY